jgi:type VI secretion system TssR-like protein
MKNRVNYLLVLFLIIISVQNKIQAQGKVEGAPLLKLTAPKTPEYCVEPHGIFLGKNAPRKASIGGGLWVVFSDRDNNQTYADKNLTIKYSTVNFLQAFFVAEETEKALRLVEWNPITNVTQDQNPKRKDVGFNDKAQEAGWISKENLLLWQTCLIDDSTFYSKKAIAVKKLNQGNFKSLIKKGVLDLYNSPDTSSEKNGKDVNLFGYLFVYKQQNNMVLLGKINNTTINQIGLDIIGWASDSRVQLWNSAICLRVNLDEDAIADRKRKNIDVRFFASPENARKFSNGDTSVARLKFLYYDPSKNEHESDNPYFYGFPITDTKLKDENIFKTGYVTNTVGADGSNIFSATKQADLNKIYENIKKSKNNIDIVFVLDGAIRNYYKTLADAIEANPNIGMKERTRHDYRLGAVIYNDSKCDDLLQTISLTPHPEIFTKKIAEEGSQPPKSCIDRGNGAPVYEALLKACSMFESNERTNVIIMLGTSGNSIVTKDKDSVEAALASKQVNMNFYQVNNKGGKIYDRYIRDCKDFLVKTASALDEKFFKEEIAAGSSKKVDLSSQDDDVYTLVNTTVPGSFFARDQNAAFSSNDINKKIKNLLNAIERHVDKILDIFTERTVGTNSSSETSASDLKEFRAYLKATYQMTDEDIEQMSSHENYQLFLEAYAPLKCKKLSDPILKRVLFMHSKEYDRVKEAIQKLASCYTGSILRQCIYDAFLQIMMDYKGGNVDTKQFEDASPEKLMMLLTGLPTNNQLFVKYKLKDIKDIRKVPDEEINLLRINFNKILEKLNEIRKHSKNKLEQYDETFYWVEEEALHVD